MQITPNQSFEHIKDAVVSYLETAYKISHPTVFAERSDILRKRGTVAQAPFVEATPSFPTSHKLAELERNHPQIASGLAELVQHGVPVDRFKLWTHQERALLASLGTQPNLLVATGTGSGKTESFLLPILSDILREAKTWVAPNGPAQRGQYDPQRDTWLHSRRHERRTAALRGIILYPMNALVNDQLSRLRRVLARGTSPDWQRRNLNGNLIHFGMYTSLTPRAGHWSDEWRRNIVHEYLESVQADWDKLSSELQSTGSWARPDSPEMLVRWDMQSAPPDILVTNYSMLEYMLVRPIEDSIFSLTRQWLENEPEARLTLVLDEAHTYTGAKGTEVAHLVRRLKERLGVESGSDKFRAIATTASLPPGKDAMIRSFVAGLFGEPEQRFTLVELEGIEPHDPHRIPSHQNMQAFQNFHDQFKLEEPLPAIEKLASDLELGLVDRTVDPQIALHQLLETQEDVRWVRQRTARNATLVDQLSNEAWGDLGTSEERERATAGVLSAGSYARAEALADTPPLISMRLHSFFRGVAGIWACMDPNCTAVEDAYRSADRPVGRLYTDPRPWCDCGARVLEVFSCRRCGLLFLGGIPDEHQGSLWPWSDSLTGEQQDIRQFRVFGVERPHRHHPVEFRSTITTLHVHQNEPLARPTYEIAAATENDQEVSPFPAQCPRCSNYRAPGVEGREVIEPLRTKGPRSFAVVVEDGFRVQPPSRPSYKPNYGRKALLFSDSRMDAAQLAADLRQIHHSDLFRQLLYRSLYACNTCKGDGKVEEIAPFVIGQEPRIDYVSCPDCGGSGQTHQPLPLKFAELQERVIGLQFELNIDPTNGVIENFFERNETGDATVYDEAKTAFNVALRRELSEDEFGLEPLGLASWQVPLPEVTGSFAPLTEPETKAFIRSIARILATENVLLPPKPLAPWDWPRNLVKPHERLVMLPAQARAEGIVPYNLRPYRKLGRYVISIAEALVEGGRLPETQKETWVNELYRPLWSALGYYGFKVMDSAGSKINDKRPMGIRIDTFELHPIDHSVERCEACGYVMSEAVLHVCVRCGQQTVPIQPGQLTNFYRKSALYALPESPYPDPYPLRAIEHTAQISLADARNSERWFQDLFRDEQNPADHRIDVLSVTTTMEMGIDIGSLLTVGLRNVPPTVPNYQQRAGRAGRRGSSIATVLTFAQFRSHDQYYFDRPPEIVSQPPRVPMLYLQNPVIARRHVRSLILQAFFSNTAGGGAGAGLFRAWGTVNEFITHDKATRMLRYLANNRAPLIQRTRKIVEASFHRDLETWIDALVTEIQEVVNTSDGNTDLLEALIGSGLLPKYAFPVDVVGLSLPTVNHPWNEDEDTNSEDRMQRDLKIALAEYAPGAEIIKGSFPNTYIYKVAGIYDAFEKQPNYGPTGKILECQDCQSLDLLSLHDPDPIHCGECGSYNIFIVPYLKPRGFTVDQAIPEGGRERYEWGGRERSGYVAPARLLVGETSFHTGQSQSPFAPKLYTQVRIGQLFVANKGTDRDFPGFLICPVCGRYFESYDVVGTHTYPANVPPHQGRNRGPRAGHRCPNQNRFENQVVLGHNFFSEVILLGVDLPGTMDAPFQQPSGKAVWYSFGTLLKNAATIVLQVNPEELAVGIRPVLRGPNRVHGEVFIYDDVPGGAGYARAIQMNMQEILEKALELGKSCPNPDCPSACYHCMFDYRNQYLHPMLDRGLGTSIIEYLLEKKSPTLTDYQIERAVRSLLEYARDAWTIHPGQEIDGRIFAQILEDGQANRYGIHVIHPVVARPPQAQAHSILAAHGIHSATHTTFDLERRPFWVLNNLVNE